MSPLKRQHMPLTSLAPAADHHGCAVSPRPAPDRCPPFLSRLEDFGRLINIDIAAPLELRSGIDETAFKRLLRAHYFNAPSNLAAVAQLRAILGDTWRQAILSVIELAACVNAQAAQLAHGPEESILWQTWKEVIGVAWSSECTARICGLKKPFRAWQAAMLVGALAFHEQFEGKLVSVVEPQRTAKVLFGPSAMRHLETMIVRYDLTCSLCIGSADIETAEPTPWGCFGAAVRMWSNHSRSHWDERLLGDFVPFAVPAVARRATQRSIEQQAMEFGELAVLCWDAALRAGHSRGQEPTPHVGHQGRLVDRY